MGHVLTHLKIIPSEADCLTISNFVLTVKKPNGPDCYGQEVLCFQTCTFLRYFKSEKRDLKI